MKSLDKVQYDSADIPKNNFGSAINEKEHSDKGDKMNEDLEPSGNLENMQLKQQVYEEMKNNNINADHLIEILRVDEKEQSEKEGQLRGNFFQSLAIKSPNSSLVTIFP